MRKAGNNLFRNIHSVTTIWEWPLSFPHFLANKIPHFGGCQGVTSVSKSSQAVVVDGKSAKAALIALIFPEYHDSVCVNWKSYTRMSCVNWKSYIQTSDNRILQSNRSFPR